MVAAAFLSSAIDVDRSLEKGMNAPKIETNDGTNVGRDANSETKTTVVSFWTPKKPASRISNKDLSRRFYDENKETEFISICIDSDKALMDEVMKIDGVKADKVFSAADVSQRTFKDYDVETNPRAFIISQEGKIQEII